jgi:hypothetical protein
MIWRRIPFLVPGCITLLILAVGSVPAPISAQATLTNNCPDVPPPQHGTIRPGNCVPVGTVIEYDIFGFTPNEEVGFWVNAPNGEISGKVETDNIGPDGGVSGVPLETADLFPGVWSIVFQGTESGHQAVIYFKLLDPGAEGGGGDPAAPPPPEPMQAPPPPAEHCGDVPPSENANIYPLNCLEYGFLFNVEIFGFAPNEAVGFWFVAPTGEQIGTRSEVTGIIGEDGRGVFEWGTSIFFAPENEAGYGVWSVVFQGTQSGHQAVAHYKVTPAGQLGQRPDGETYCADLPPSVNGGAQPGACIFGGHLIQLGASGFGPNEPVGFWFTAPDGAVLGTRSEVQVSEEGTIFLPVLDSGQLSPGIWTMVVQATTSQRSAVVYFKIVEPNAPPPEPQGVVCGEVVLPLPANTQVSPGQCVSADSSVEMVFTGFAPEEPIRLLMTTPTGETKGGDTVATPDGTYVSSGVQFSEEVPQYGPGIYTFSVTGLNSGHVANVSVAAQ